VILRMVRWVLGRVILALDRLFQPRLPERSPEAQARVDSLTRGLAVYEFLSCPFCVKVRRAMRARGMDIERRDVNLNEQWKQELVREGGAFQVPCLRIPEPGNQARWLYESDDIIAYLDRLVSEQP
jgi:glutaredoxin